MKAEATTAAANTAMSTRAPGRRLTSVDDVPTAHSRHEMAEHMAVVEPAPGFCSIHRTRKRVTRAEDLLSA